MPDHQSFRIHIYHDGAMFGVRVRGKKKYLMYKAFLNELEGRQYYPEPGGDIYMLNDEQLAAFGRSREMPRASRADSPSKTSNRSPA